MFDVVVVVVWCRGENIAALNTTARRGGGTIGLVLEELWWWLLGLQCSGDHRRRSSSGRQLLLTVVLLLELLESQLLLLLHKRQLLLLLLLHGCGGARVVWIAHWQRGGVRTGKGGVVLFRGRVVDPEDESRLMVKKSKNKTEVGLPRREREIEREKADRKTAVYSTMQSVRDSWRERV